MIDKAYSSLTSEALSYCWRQLVQRIGGSIEQTDSYISSMGIPLRYSSLDRLQAEQSPSIIVTPCAEDTWQRLLEKDTDSLSWLPAEKVFPSNSKLPFHDPVPVLFWGEGYEGGSKPFAERREDSTIIFYADIIAATFFMLTRWEETVSSVRDQHGRFPATASVAYKQGFLDRPIVDEYALILQGWLKILLPGWAPQSPHFSVKLSHDIDLVRYASLRTVVGDVIKRRSIHRSFSTMCQLLYPYTDAYLRGCYELSDTSEKNGFRSAFYFMSADRGYLDNGYDPNTKLLQKLIQDLRLRGHEVGFHPGYQTFEDQERFMVEKERMDKALGVSQYGGRQHILRFRAPKTWQIWDEAGMSYDSTLSYADHEGFRCGTCHAFHPFDLTRGCQLKLLELPLVIMEVTLRRYGNLTPEQGEERIMKLAQRCKAVNGVFTLLWHNTSLQGEWVPWAAMYRRVLPGLAALEERAAPLPGNEVS